MEVRDKSGVTVRERKGVTSIPMEIDHLLKDRASWEAHYLPRLRYTADRVYRAPKNERTQFAPLVPDGLAYLRNPAREEPVGLHCGSLFGEIRNWLGLAGTSYLAADDEPLFDEIIDTVGALSYQCVQEVLASGATFDFAHFWEDICFRGGPLIAPSVFHTKIGPLYARITALLRAHGIAIVSVDCDGCIDALIPTWLENGVNTMFPIEVGVWGASIAPWRAKYGQELRGVGGIDKRIFARDFAAIDAEVERLKPLVELGGYIPCPDHRLASDAKWDNVRYYCERIRAVFT
jgi:uroporphyrinogen decarboxylase